MTVIVGQHIVRLGGILAGVFKKTWDFFGSVWTSTLRPFITWSWNMIQKLHAWLKGVLTPVLNFLDALRQDILDIYNKWFRPIFDTIDALRQTLRALELFHVPFARKIDDALGALEARLLQPIRLALTKINELANWVNRIIDLNGLFQRLTLIESTWRYVGDTWAVLLKHQPAGVSRAQNEALHGLEVRPTDPKQLADALTAHYRAGAGELQPAIDQLVPLWRASVAQ